MYGTIREGGVANICMRGLSHLLSGYEGCTYVLSARAESKQTRMHMYSGAWTFTVRPVESRVSVYLDLLTQRRGANSHTKITCHLLVSIFAKSTRLKSFTPVCLDNPYRVSESSLRI